MIELYDGVRLVVILWKFCGNFVMKQGDAKESTCVESKISQECQDRVRIKERDKWLGFLTGIMVVSIFAPKLMVWHNHTIHTLNASNKPQQQVYIARFALNQ